MEELIDIYNAQRERTGRTVVRKGAFLSEGEYMCYVLAIVRDLRGRYLVTQRSFDKHWAPGCWEVPGGGVLSGEEPAQAVVRELREEVGLDVSACLDDPVFTYTNVDLERGDNYIVDIFLFQLDVAEDDLVLQESEAVACAFASWEDICALADRGEFLHFERVRCALGKN